MEPCISCFYSHLLYGIYVKIFIMNQYIPKSQWRLSHNGREYYWLTIYRAGAAVVSTIIRIIRINFKIILYSIPANFVWFIGVTFLSWQCQDFSYSSDNIRRSLKTVQRYSEEFHLTRTQELEEWHDFFSSGFGY